MKVPEKIYVKPLLMEDGESIMGKCSEKPKKGYTIEYIRKDALIEILEKVAASYKKRSDEGELVWQNMCGIKEAIEILNKM